jgi:hypothetical protein
MMTIDFIVMMNKIKTRKEYNETLQYLNNYACILKKIKARDQDKVNKP